jgi:hypothetical protein
MPECSAVSCHVWVEAQLGEDGVVKDTESAEADV